MIHHDVQMWDELGKLDSITSSRLAAERVRVTANIPSKNIFIQWNVTINDLNVSYRK